MSQLGQLTPSSVWNYFEEICRIPRLSKNEGKIREYLISFAKNNGLEAKEDKTGNILITRPASPGKENIKPIVLQSHMDMVGEKNSDHPHNWKNDPIIPVIDNGYVRASGTTLGADDGIGIAAQMAILTDKNLNCGLIECLFTVDEETGMTGAINLEPGFFQSKTLLNLDSEDEGILYIGCAGGIDSQAFMTFEPVNVHEGEKAVSISVTGLHGGHSGDEIHKGYGNSIKIITSLLYHLELEYKIAVTYIEGGNLRNAIPREAFATITFNPQYESAIKAVIEKLSLIIKDELRSMEPDLKITFAPVSTPQTAIDPVTQHRLLSALTACPHGVLSWSSEMPGMVETSTNLAIVKMLENNKIQIVSTQRSSSELDKHNAAAMVESCFELAGAIITHSDGYPGWRPNINSEILNRMKASYLKLFNKEPEVKAIHAGLECGLINEKYKGIDMISFGPTIRGAHTPEEKIEIVTVQMFWDLLLDTIDYKE
jgi:dipeptidase D